ncbi:ubiquitin carboxyl-hydrolase [Bacteroides sp.]|uniref:ubiquitin carboxyl-hydrolase n=1 Tax=Bacteroides sp. TaxID=29523 RepID=UPI002A7F8590|nr:ubiquitin carboxyl-hydrolase [Bacteroides sp.]
MNKKKETKVTKVVCSQCGAEFGIAEKEFTAVTTVIGKDSNLGTVYPAVVGQGASSRTTKSSQERIDALRNAGVDVSHLFAIQGANGGEYIASNKNGIFTFLDDNDPLFDLITSQGTVPNRRLFRRWVMAQMFHMMSETAYRSKELLGVTEMIHQFGYEYQWKMLMDELYAQMKMEGRDLENFTDRNRWFNAGVVVSMAEDYIVQLQKYVDALKVRKCKTIPYKRIRNRNIFVSDLQDKLYKPFCSATTRIRKAKNAAQLFDAAKKFNDMRIKMSHDTPQSKSWVDAYKGSGAYFTMQNLIRFHNCIAINDTGKRLNKCQSLAFISAKGEEYKDGEGWRLLAVLKKMLEDNNIDIKKKMATWRKNK